MEQKETVVIRLVAENNSADEWITVHANSFISLKRPCKAGFTFCGWCTKQNPYLENATIVSDKIFVEKNLSLYALWTSQTGSDNVEFIPYQQIGNEVTLCASLNYRGEKSFIVPPVYCNCTVVKIDAEKFMIGELELAEIVIPSTVGALEPHIFQYCFQLEKLTLPMMNVGKLFNINTTDDSEANKYPRLREIIINSGGYVCQSCFESFSTIKHITLCSTIKAIEEGAFSGCTSLEHVYNMQNVESVGKRAFFFCQSLTGIDSLKNLHYLDDEAFSGCSSLKEIVLEKDLRMTGSRIFAGCRSLQKIKIRAKINTLKSKMFLNCLELKTVELPEGLKAIEESCFENCCCLQDISLPKSVIFIERRAFLNCLSLFRITLNTRIKNISTGAFANCFKLIEVENTSKLKLKLDSRIHGAVAKYACEIIDNPKLSQIEKTEDGLFFYHEDDKYHLFNISDDITDLILPEKYREKYYDIRQYAFACKSNLTRCDLSKVKNIDTHGLFCNCPSLQEVILSGDVKEIKDYAFYNCPTLKKCWIPDSVKTIRRSAFKGTSSSLTVVKKVF